MTSTQERRPPKETAPELTSSRIPPTSDAAVDLHAIVTSAHVTTWDGRPSLAVTVACPWCSREHSHGWPFRPIQDDERGTVGDCVPRELLGSRYRLDDPRGLALYAIRDHTTRKPVAP